MNQYNTLNANSSSFQLNKLKSGIKNVTELTLNLGLVILKMKIFSRQTIITDTQVSRLRKAFANKSSWYS